MVDQLGNQQPLERRNVLDRGLIQCNDQVADPKSRVIYRS